MERMEEQSKKASQQMSFMIERIKTVQKSLTLEITNKNPNSVTLGTRPRLTEINLEKQKKSSLEYKLYYI